VDNQEERELTKTADRLEHEADEMQARTEKLDHDIESVRQDFRQKRNDDNVPGVPPEPEAERGEPERSPDDQFGSPTPDDYEGDEVS
jgi:hypothetical protein